MVEFKPTKDSEALGAFAKAMRAYSDLARGVEIIHSLGGPRVTIEQPLVDWLNSLRAKAMKILGVKDEN